MFQFQQNNQNALTGKKDLFLSPDEKQKNSGFYVNQFNTQSPDPVNNRQEYSPFVIKNGCYSNSSTKALTFLTEKKRKTSNKFYTPSPNTCKTDKLSDRFIPMNKGINLMEKFNLANRYEELDENFNDSNIDDTYVDSNMKYNEILKQNVLNENLNPPFFNQKTLSGNKHSNQNLKTKIFSFKSEIKPKPNFYYSIINNKKDREGSINEDIQRKINPKPYKILEAPNLMDDFYLNLVDWSAKNDIAVGLGNKVCLWCTNQTQETTLCTYQNTNDKYVSSVMWSQTGDNLAVGNSRGQVEIYDGKYLN